MKTNPLFFWKGKNISKDVTRSYSESLTIRSKLSEVAVLVPEQSSSFLRERNEKEKQADDLFRQLRFFFIVGRLFGIIPFSGVFTRSPSCQNLSFW